MSQPAERRNQKPDEAWHARVAWVVVVVVLPLVSALVFLAEVTR